MAILTEESRVTATEVASIGSMAEAAVGVAIIVLAIIGLAGIAVEPMIAIATIIVGVALLMQGTETAAETTVMPAIVGASAGAGIMVEFLAGAAGIILGILAFVKGSALTIAPAALIVFGGALLLGGIANSVSPVRTGAGPDASLGLIHQARIGAAGAQVMIGFAVGILGILAYALAGALAVNVHTLILVGLLAVGASLILTSAAIGFPQFMGSRAQETTVVTPRGPLGGE